MRLEVLLVALCAAVCLGASPRWSEASLQALRSRRRGTTADSAPAVPVHALQERAVCTFALQERSLQLEGGAEVRVQEVVCAQQRPRLRLKLDVRDAVDAATATTTGPVRLSCRQAQVSVGAHVVRSGCVLVNDDLQAAADPRPDLAA